MMTACGAADLIASPHEEALLPANLNGCPEWRDATQPSPQTQGHSYGLQYWFSLLMSLARISSGPVRAAIADARASKRSCISWDSTGSPPLLSPNRARRRRPISTVQVVGVSKRGSGIFVNDLPGSAPCPTCVTISSSAARAL